MLYIRRHSSAPPPSLGAAVLESGVFGTRCTEAESRAINCVRSEWARCALVRIGSEARGWSVGLGRVLGCVGPNL